MNPHIKGKLEKLRQSLPEDKRQEFDDEEAFISGVVDNTRNTDELVNALIRELTNARRKNREIKGFLISLGEVLPPNRIVGLHTAMGEAKDELNGITLQMSSTEFTRLPVITCNETKKQYVMNWEGICRLAIRSGVADKESGV